MVLVVTGEKLPIWDIQIPKNGLLINATKQKIH